MIQRPGVQTRGKTKRHNLDCRVAHSVATLTKNLAQICVNLIRCMTPGSLRCPQNTTRRSRTTTREQQKNKAHYSPLATCRAALAPTVGVLLLFAEAVRLEKEPAQRRARPSSFLVSRQHDAYSLHWQHISQHGWACLPDERRARILAARRGRLPAGAP